MSDYGDISSNDEDYSEKRKTSSKQTSNTSTRRDDGPESWLSKNDTAKTKKSPLVVEQRVTKLKKVESSKLIWAKCTYFKSGPFCPARIAEVGEASCEKNIPTSIPSEFELVEFFCLPLKNPAIPRFVVCNKKDIVAFDSALNGRKQLLLRNSYGHNSVMDVDELKWDLGRMDTLHQVQYFFARNSLFEASIYKLDMQNYSTVEAEMYQFLCVSISCLVTETEAEI